MAELATDPGILQKFVDRCTSLYTLPAVAMDVLELTSQPRVDLRALKECIERDPAMTCKILRVVNSSMFGLSREVSDLNQALALLGVKPLKLLVLGFSLPKALFDEMEASTLERYWRFTLLKAVAAREICNEFWASDSGDEAFIVALLHDIGLLVLVQELGDSYVSFLHSVLERKGPLLSLETETMGFDHTALSARLLDQWRLPERIVRAAQHPLDIEHLAALEEDESLLPQVLHLATLIASLLVDQRHEALIELQDAAARYRNAKVEQIDGLLDEIQERVGVMAGVFSVSVNEQESYRDILSRAHLQLSEAAVDALPEMLRPDPGPAVADHQATLNQALMSYATSDAAPKPGSDGVTGAPPKATVTRSEPEKSGTGRAVTKANGQEMDPGLIGRLSAAAAECRAKRQELSLVLLEIDNLDSLLVAAGHEKAMAVAQRLTATIQAFVDQECDCLMVRDGRYALTLPDSDRQQAASTTRRLVAAYPQWFHSVGQTRIPVVCSAGVATWASPGRSLPAEDLIEAAARCLFAAQASGGGVVKSIDVL